MAVRLTRAVPNARRIAMSWVTVALLGALFVGQTELVRVGRAAVMVIALYAFALAMDPENKVLDLVAYAWAGFGAAFGPTILLALFWPRMTRNGALAGIITGELTVVVWKQRGERRGNASNLSF